MIEFRTLGEVSLTAGDGRTLRSVLAQPKRLALLAYLASPRTSDFVPRGLLLGSFWPEWDEERARHALRTSLYFLRQALGTDILISRGHQEVGLDAARLHCDAVALEDALEAGEDARALDLYGGDYLQGLVVEGAREFERWVEGERRRFRLRVRDAARRLAEAALSRGEGAEAERRARRAAALDPWDEATLRLLMRVLAHRGNRAEALRAYERFADLARRELRLEPSADSEALAGRIRDGEAVVGAELAAASPKRGGRRDPDPPSAGNGLPTAVPAAPSPTDGRATATTARRATGAPGLLSRLWRPWPAVALLVAGLGVILAYHRPTRRSSPTVSRAIGPPGTSANRSIAVLPLENLGPDSTNAYFAGGMTEEITRALTLVPGLAVTSRTSAAAFSGSKITAPRIADSLGVRYLVEGGASLLGGEATITVGLIDAQTDTTVWSDRFVRPARHLPELEVDVAGRIARALRSSLTDDERRAILADQTRDPVAFGLYLRAEDLGPWPDSSIVAREAALLRQAVTRDSTFTWAWFVLANLYQGMVGPEWADSGRAAFAHFALHARTPRARALAVAAPAFFAAHLDTATAALGEVLARDPYDPLLLPLQANAVAFRGNLVEALRLRRRWRDLDPLNPACWASLGYTYMLLRMDDKSEWALTKALDLDRRSYDAWSTLIVLREITGKYSEALALEDTLAAVVGDPEEVETRGELYLWMGDVRRGRRLLDSAYRTEAWSDFALHTPELVRARLLTGDTVGLAELVRRAQTTVQPLWSAILPIRLAAVQGRGPKAARLIREYMNGRARLLRFVIDDPDFGAARSDTAFQAAVQEARTRLARQRREARRMVAEGSRSN